MENGKVICGGFEGPEEMKGDHAPCEFCARPYGDHGAVEKTTSWRRAVDVSLPRASSAPTAVRVSTTTTEVRNSRHCPPLLSPWQSFIPGALAVVLNDRLDWIDYVAKPEPILQETDVCMTLNRNVGDFFQGSDLGLFTAQGRLHLLPAESNQSEKKSKKQKSPTKEAPKKEEGEGEEGEASTNQSDPKKFLNPFGSPDCVIRSPTWDVIGVIEVRVPWGLQLKNDSLEEQFNNRSLKVREAKAIAQVAGYMLDNKRAYGVLTTYNQTRFFHMISTDHVEISPLVEADSKTGVDTVTLRRAFAYCMQLCRQHPEMPPGTTRRSSTPLSSSTALLNLNSSLGRELDQQNVALLLFTHPLYVDWDELEIQDDLGGGRCGSVFLMIWRGRKLALKLFDIEKHGLGSFEQELWMHMNLLATHAKIAKLVLVTTSPSGQRLSSFASLQLTN